MAYLTVTISHKVRYKTKKCHKEHILVKMKIMFGLKARRDFIIFAVIGILDSDDGFNFLNPCNIFLNNKFLCDASKIQI